MVVDNREPFDWCEYAAQEFGTVAQASIEYATRGWVGPISGDETMRRRRADDREFFARAPKAHACRPLPFSA